MACYSSYEVSEHTSNHVIYLIVFQESWKPVLKFTSLHLSPHMAASVFCEGLEFTALSQAPSTTQGKPLYVSYIVCLQAHNRLFMLLNLASWVAVLSFLADI